jgi:hypothetical protein
VDDDDHTFSSDAWKAAEQPQLALPGPPSLEEVRLRKRLDTLNAQYAALGKRAVTAEFEREVLHAQLANSQAQLAAHKKDTSALRAELTALREEMTFRLSAAAPSPTPQSDTSSAELEKLRAEVTAIKEKTAAAASTEQRIQSLEDSIRQLVTLMASSVLPATAHLPPAAASTPNHQDAASQPMSTGPAGAQPPPGPPPPPQPQRPAAPTTPAETDVVGQVKQLLKGVKKWLPHLPSGPPPKTGGGQPGTWAGRAAAGKKTKGTNIQAPAPQRKPPSPDLASSPHLVFSFVLSGFSSLQGWEDPRELTDQVRATFKVHLGIDVPITSAFYLGRRTDATRGRLQRVYVQLGSPADGDLVRRSRCKLKGQPGVIADALTKEELAYRNLLRSVYESYKAKGTSVQFQRSRLFEKVKGEDGSLKKREITPWEKKV